MKTPRDWPALLEEIRAQGIKLSKNGVNHWRAEFPDGRVVAFGESKDWRAIQNTVSDLKRHGFKWPPPPRAEREAPAIVFGKCPACGQQTWDPVKGDCEACSKERGLPYPTPQPLPVAEMPLDALYAELKAAIEILARAKEVAHEKAVELARATNASKVAADELRVAESILAQAKARLLQRVEADCSPAA